MKFGIKCDEMKKNKLKIQKSKEIDELLLQRQKRCADIRYLWITGKFLSPSNGTIQNTHFELNYHFELPMFTVNWRMSTNSRPKGNKKQTQRFLYQIRPISAAGASYTNEELSNFKMLIYAVCINTVKEILQTANNLNLEFEKEENKANAEFILNSHDNNGDSFKEIAERITPIINDKTFIEAFENCRETLEEHQLFFFNRLDVIVGETYNPCVLDVMKLPRNTRGITELHIEFDEFEYIFIDDSDIKGERRVWEHSFDKILAIIYVVSLVGYDRMIEREDGTQTTELKNDLMEFSYLLSDPYLMDIPIILILNDRDLLKDKISRVPLNNFFPKYLGDNGFESAYEFIKELFLSEVAIHQSEVRDPRIIFTHLASDQYEDVRFVFNCLREVVLKQTLARYGI